MPSASEQGFVLIEVLVSALVLVIASAGVFALLQTTVRQQSEQRHASEAYALAQEDQARLSSMRLGSLSRLSETYPVRLNQTEFTIHSQGRFINDTTSTASCGEDTATADYVEITSTVTWPGMTSDEKAKIVSILSPSNGSLDPNNGTLALQVTSEAMVGMPNVEVTGSNGGTGTFSGSTDASGCAVFADLTTTPTGNYTMTLSGASTGLINKDGLSTVQETVGVKPGETVLVSRHFDRPGAIPVRFRYRVGSTSELKSTKADSIVVKHTGMTNSRVFQTTNGELADSVTASPLFPFTSAYTLYAGSCSAHDPNENGESNSPYAAAAPTALAPAGDTADEVWIQLPVFEATVWSGRNASNKGTAYPNADVLIRDASCTGNNEPAPRRLTTGSDGKLTEVAALPWGTYKVCVDTTTGSGSSRKHTIEVAIKNLSSATSRDFYLGSGLPSESTSGSCL